MPRRVIIVSIHCALDGLIMALWSYDLTSLYKVSARPELVKLNKIEQIETDRCCDQADTLCARWASNGVGIRYARRSVTRKCESDRHIKSLTTQSARTGYGISTFSIVKAKLIC